MGEAKQKRRQKDAARAELIRYAEAGFLVGAETFKGAPAVDLAEAVLSYPDWRTLLERLRSGSNVAVLDHYRSPSEFFTDREFVPENATLGLLIFSAVMLAAQLAPRESRLLVSTVTTPSAAANDDRAWFIKNPDRNLRLRDSYEGEYPGPRPQSGRMPLTLVIRMMPGAYTRTLPLIAFDGDTNVSDAKLAALALSASGFLQIPEAMAGEDGLRLRQALSPYF